MFEPGETNVVCTDLERSAQFYRDTLGFRFVEEEDGAMRLDVGGRSFLLLPFAEREDAEPYGSRATFSIDLMVDDLGAASERLRAAGARFDREWAAGARSVIVRDPDGLVIEVIERRRG